MRSRLDEARIALNLSAASYTDPGLSAGYLVKAVHIQELRDRVREALGSLPMPRDGLASLSYDNASNRITTSGFAYDAAGNQVRALAQGGGSQRFKYDAANRLVQVKADDNVTVIAAYTYGDSNERLISYESGYRTYFDCEGGATIAEYNEADSSSVPVWSKSDVYLGNRLLSTLTPSGGGEAVQYHHPDRLGTRLVTDPVAGTSFEQVTLPFGTPLNAESTGSTNRRFTSYDRSATTGLDYAYNRHYDSQQGRFTQVDPIAMGAVSLTSPQTLNLYAYCTNDPINHIDPSGLGFFSFLKKIFKGIAKILTNKWVLLVVGIALGALSGLGFYLAFTEAAQGATFNPFFLKAAIALAAMSALLIVGSSHPNFLRVVQTVGGILSSIQGVVGLINGTINGTVLGTLGTPPWNPDAGNGVGAVFNFTNSGRVRLWDGSLALYIGERARLLRILRNKSSECAKFLRSKLGINGTRIARTVQSVRQFSGPDSTISASDAGLLPNGDPRSVQDIFAQYDPYAATAGYARASRGATLRDVYFSTKGLNASTILHESLHVFTGLNDDQLKNALGVSGPGSHIITTTLADHGCK